jgi:hypothetical protein
MEHKAVMKSMEEILLLRIGQQQRHRGWLLVPLQCDTF